MGEIPVEWDNLAGFDTDPRAGRITADGYVTRFGDLNLSCTAPGTDCHPIKLVQAFAGRYLSQFSWCQARRAEFLSREIYQSETSISAWRDVCGERPGRGVLGLDRAEQLSADSITMNRPNVILLTIDTLRADRLGCYGHNAHITPNIDRLAHSGIRFEQAISGGSWTQAAFPVLLTSSYAAMYGGCLGRLAPERPSPIETLASHGYSTGGFSTNLHLSRATGFDRGFHHFVELNPVEVDPRLRRIKGGPAPLAK